MSITNRSFPMGMNYEQGVGFSEYTGYWPTPEARTGVVTIIDDNDYKHTLVLDFKDGKFYDISLRDGPLGSGIQALYKDKIDVDGTGGYDIEPEVKFKEDTGEYERFTTEHLSSRFYVRPNKETNRNQTGYDVSGYPTGIELTSKIYVDGEPTTQTATAENISKIGEIVYDRKAEGHRLQTVFSANKSDFQLVGRQQEYITKDIIQNPDSRINTEGNHQSSLSDPLLWVTRGETPFYDRVSGDRINTTPTFSVGPDGKTDSAFYINESVYGIKTPDVLDSSSKTVSFWIKCAGLITFTGIASGVSEYDSSGDWTLYYASGVTDTGKVEITRVAEDIEVFDIRVYSGNKTSDLEYYFNDIIENSGNNVCPIF